MTVESGLIAARFVHFAALALFFGLALFPRYGLSGAFNPAAALRTRRVLGWSAGVALASALAWLGFSTASMIGRAIDPAALLLVARETEFGRRWMVRLPLLAVLSVLLLTRKPGEAATTAETLIAGALLASLAWVGHGGEGEGGSAILHRMADAVHLLAASFWLGALIGFLMLGRAAMRTADGARLLCAALTRFAGIGPGIVVLLIFTGLVNSWFLVGPAHALSLVSSPYGQVLAVKIVLFAAMLLVAAANRYWLTPHLARALVHQHTTEAVRRLRLSLAAETALALLVFAAVGALGTLSPPGLE